MTESQKLLLFKKYYLYSKNTIQKDITIMNLFRWELCGWTIVDEFMMRNKIFTESQRIHKICVNYKELWQRYSEQIW